MSNVFQINDNDLYLVISLLLASLGFIIYWFVSQDEQKRIWFFKTYENNDAWLNWIVFKRLCGALILGIIPTIIALLFLPFSLKELGLNFDNLALTCKWTVGLSLFFLVANFFAANTPSKLEVYPPLRVKSWSKKVILLNTISWLAYLFAYEFLFRGILLITCFKYLGFWPAVVINIAFYALAHIPKGFTETIGCFPYGFLLCYITLLTGNLWFAFITHSVLAISTDFYSVFYSREMYFLK